MGGRVRGRVGDGSVLLVNMCKNTYNRLTLPLSSLFVRRGRKERKGKVDRRGKERGWGLVGEEGEAE